MSNCGVAVPGFDPFFGDPNFFLWGVTERVTPAAILGSSQRQRQRQTLEPFE
jgi:hypothetical protein